MDNPSSVPSSSSRFLSKCPAAKYGVSQAEAIPCTTCFISTNRGSYRGNKGPFLPQRKFQNFKHKDPGAVTLDQQIQNLLQNNAIESTVSTKGFFSSVFTVPKKDGGWRPIIYKVPQFLPGSLSFQNGSLKDVLQEGNFMGKINLEDAHLSVPVHQEHRDFLKFCWRQKIYRFRSLPFGLATAPRVFTKMWPLVARMRETGLCIIVYLDDILVMAQST